MSRSTKRFADFAGRGISPDARGHGRPDLELRGEPSAADRLDREPGFAISAVTYMELAQGVRDEDELGILRRPLRFWSAEILDVDSSISARAMFLVEQHARADSLPLADALIAAIALEHGIVLLTGNADHYRPFEGLAIESFRP